MAKIDDAARSLIFLAARGAPDIDALSPGEIRAFNAVLPAGRALRQA